MPYLLDRGYKKLDYIIISHFDQDHVGGIFTIIEELKVGKVFIGKQIEKSENYEKFLALIKEKKTDVEIVNKGNNIKIDKNVYFEVLWPDKERLIEENGLNNNSIVCRLKYNNFSMLFTGDIEESAEKVILNDYKDKGFLNTNILKVDHHASKSSSINTFLEEVSPEVSLIGVGKENKFGHPNDEVVKRLENIRIKNI